MFRRIHMCSSKFNLLKVRQVLSLRLVYIHIFQIRITSVLVRAGLD